jgi:hypothetical protein
MMEQRCIVCGCPCADHVPLRYLLRVWTRHYGGQLLGAVLGRLVMVGRG